MEKDYTPTPSDSQGDSGNKSVQNASQKGKNLILALCDLEDAQFFPPEERETEDAQDSSSLPFSLEGEVDPSEKSKESKKESLDPKETKETKETKQESLATKEPKKSKESNESPKTQEPKESKQKQKSKKAKMPKESKESKESKKAIETKESTQKITPPHHSILNMESKDNTDPEVTTLVLPHGTETLPLVLEEDNQRGATYRRKLLSEEKQQALGHRSRQIDSFLKNGFQGWPEHHILEFALFFVFSQGDTKSFARELIATFGSLREVLDASYEDLQKVHNIGPKASLFLTFLSEISIVYLGQIPKVELLVHSTETARELLFPYFLKAKNERCFILCLNGEKQFIGIRSVGEGGFSSSVMDARRIAEECIRLGAIYLYISHNHVHQSALPSENDWATTEHLTTVLSCLQLFVVDHLIFGQDDFVSMKEQEALSTRNIPWA